MQNTQFWLNGYKVNEGRMFRFVITPKMVSEALEIENKLNGKSMLARIQTGDRIWFVNIENIIPSVDDDWSNIDEKDKVIEIFSGDILEYIPDWNSLVNTKQEEQDRRNAFRNAWDRIKIENDPIKLIRSHFSSHDMEVTYGRRDNGKAFKRYNLAIVNDSELSFKGRHLDVEFGLNKRFTNTEKIYDILKSWAAYEDFLTKLADANIDIVLEENTCIYATYGIVDNTIRGKVEDTKYGPQFGFEWVTFIKYGIKIKLAICSRYLNDLRAENAISSIARELNTEIPSLVEVLK